MSGLLLFLVETDLTQDELQKVYSDKFVADRLSIPGFVNAQRYKAIDGKTPSRLALYNLASHSIVASSQYQSSVLDLSSQPTEALNRFTTLNRRTYELIFEQCAPKATPSVSEDFTPARHILFVGMDIIDPSLDTDINDWYNDEHIPDITKVRGWIRSRRYKLHSSDELSLNSNTETPPGHQYLALHEFDNGDMMSDPAFVAAGKTEKAEEYRSKVDLMIRSFELFKRFQ